jgi:hypothetical protein
MPQGTRPSVRFITAPASGIARKMSGVLTYNLNSTADKDS